MSKTQSDQRSKEHKQSLVIEGEARVGRVDFLEEATFKLIFGG